MITSERPELDLDELRRLAVEYYQLHRAAHKEFHTLKRAHGEEFQKRNPGAHRRTALHDFLQRPVVLDAIDAEQLYGRFAQIHAAMLTMELLWRQHQASKVVISESDYTDHINRMEEMTWSP